MLERLEVLATPLEDVAGEEAPKLNAEPDVLAGGRAPVERIPEPEERLVPLKLFVVAIGVILGLERDVARVHRRERESRRNR